MELREKEERYRILVDRIIEYRLAFTKSVFQIGLDLKEIKERELYLLEFRDFETFLEKKVDISRTNAYRCISIATEFKLTDFNKWGLSKLEIIKRELPEPEDRKEYMKTS